jgi:hypothetical protein
MTIGLCIRTNLVKPSGKAFRASPLTYRLGARLVSEAYLPKGKTTASYACKAPKPLTKGLKGLCRL